jgi:hypothetical protein
MKRFKFVALLVAICTWPVVAIGVTSAGAQVQDPAVIVDNLDETGGLEMPGVALPDVDASAAGYKWCNYPHHSDHHANNGRIYHHYHQCTSNSCYDIWQTNNVSSQQSSRAANKDCRYR